MTQNIKSIPRRKVLKMIGAATTILPVCGKAETSHIVTLSFDDGFLQSSLKTAEIYEKYDVSACINVIATAHLKSFKLPNEYHKWPVGDFGVWNELQERGHEIMPHGLIHANLRDMPFEKAKDLVMRCLDDEGWGPMTAEFLDELLARLSSIDSVAVLPAGRALARI